MNPRSILASAALFGSIAVSGTALASPNGVEYDGAVAGPLMITSVWQNPGVTWTFDTSNLSPGGDTVIHVQDGNDLQGGFVEGNDDFGGTLASHVVVPPAATGRMLVILVRAYFDTTGGTCTLQATPSSGSGFTMTDRFGGSTHYIGDVPLGAHVTTAERQGGTTDTLMLVLSSRTHAVAYDDDEGVGNMSWAHLNEACPACTVILGNYPGSTTPDLVGRANLIWDADADTADADADGLGDGLETLLGTSTNSALVDPACQGAQCEKIGADTDMDGISDAFELLGKEAVPRVLFPAWGADPKLPDLFVEYDWVTCPTCTFTDRYKFGGGQANDHWAPAPADAVEAIRQAYLPIRVHIDIGIPNPTPSTQLDWGDWGGSEQLGESDPPPCTGRTPARQGLFHHVVGGVATWSGISVDCSMANPIPAAFAHEVGHSLGLEHGGRAFSGAVNSKPNYPSIANYLFYYGPSFSHGTSATLNPASLDEQFGLGASPNPLAMEKIRNNWCKGGNGGDGTSGSRCISGNAIDWNRDGIFSPSSSPVRGAVTMAHTAYARSVFPPGQLNDPAMAWVSPGGSVGDRLWILGRGPANQLQYAVRTRANLDACGSLTSIDEGPADCAGFFKPTPQDPAPVPVHDFPGNKISSYAPGVGELTNFFGSFSNRLVVVSQPTSGTLISNVVDNATSNPSFGSNVVLPGGIAATGDVSALSTGTGVVTAWAPAGGRLKQWTYQNNAWSGPVDQRWDDGTFISPLYGIGVTRGFDQAVGTSMRTYAAIAVAPSGTIEFARQEPTTGRWTRLNSSWNDLGVRPVVQGRPGLAYQRTSAALGNSVGRFYMAVNLRQDCTSPGPFYPFGGDGDGCVARLIKTEGNSFSTNASRRLVWVSPSVLYGATAQGAGSLDALRGISLISDLTRDTNLRAAKVYPFLPDPDGAGPDGPPRSAPELEFSPLADGIVNFNLRDIDDYQYIQYNLRVSLGLKTAAPPLP